MLTVKIYVYTVTALSLLYSFNVINKPWVTLMYVAML